MLKKLAKPPEAVQPSEAVQPPEAVQLVEISVKQLATQMYKNRVGMVNYIIIARELGFEMGLKELKDAWDEVRHE